MIKKRDLFVVFLSMFFVLIIPLAFAVGVEVVDIADKGITGEVITGEIITGEMITGEVSQYTNISITITSALSLDLIKPSNGTYFESTTIPLQFDFTDVSSIWYNLDHGSNVSITENTTFSASEGSHMLYLFAGNDFANVSASAGFYVNVTLFEVVYGEYNDTLRGNSTDFFDFTFEEMQNLSDVIIENTNHGKIKFKELINVSDDENPSDRRVNVDSHVNVSHNRVFLNATALPNFNKSATLSLYGLAFNSPVILKDGVACPTVVCKQESYVGGRLKFNVTGFSVYSAAEGAVPSPPSGGRGGRAEPKDLVITPSELNVELLQGGAVRKTIQLYNKGGNQLNVVLSQERLEDFLIFPEGVNFDIGAGEKKDVSLDFVAEDDGVGVFVGNIIVVAEGFREVVDVVVVVESAEISFDVDLNVPSEYLELQPGMIIPVGVDVSATGPVVKGELSYFIKNLNDEIIFEDTELIDIKEQSFVKEIQVPYDLDDGKYVLYAVLSYGVEVAIGSAPLFEFTAPAPPFKIPVNILLGSLVAVLVVLIVFVVLKSYRERRPIMEIALGRRIR